MTAFAYKHVRIESYGVHLPKNEVTSSEIEDRIAPLYEKLRIPFGTLERLSGVKSRKMWGRETAPSEAGAAAATIALDDLGFDRKHIGALFSCSVSRDFFEPSTGCIMHSRLGLSSNVMALDITNACIGFSNGLTLMANLIEAGSIKAGLVVSGENPSIMIDGTFSHLKNNFDSMTREELLKVVPTFTLGCGAVAFVLCHDSIATKGHKLLGGVAHTASEHADLCAGNADFCVMTDEDTAPIMHTESSRLIPAASRLGGETWAEASKVLGWTRDDVDHIFCHQVGRQVNEAFYKEMNLDMSKEFTIYKDHGNMVSSAMPVCLIKGVEEKGIKAGEKIVCTAFGSGLNSVFLGIEW